MLISSALEILWKSSTWLCMRLHMHVDARACAVWGREFLFVCLCSRCAYMCACLRACTLHAHVCQHSVVQVHQGYAPPIVRQQGCNPAGNGPIDTIQHPLNGRHCQETTAMKGARLARHPKLHTSSSACAIAGEAPAASSVLAMMSMLTKLVMHLLWRRWHSHGGVWACVGSTSRMARPQQA